MERKRRNFTVTGRFFEERRPLAQRQIPPPRYEVPEGRRPIPRLGVRGPGPKVDVSASDLAEMIGTKALNDAILFLDTNIFTTHLDPTVWDAILSKHVYIAPQVWEELKPWLKTPFQNPRVRDRVVAAVEEQAADLTAAKKAGNPILWSASADPGIRILFEDENLFSHGSKYYTNLLSLRKFRGVAAQYQLTKKLGRPPTQNELLAEIQPELGERGFQLAKKGAAAGRSPNIFADEEIVTLAFITALLKGSEVVIVTRDADVLEQYCKLRLLLKEHYRAMLFAEEHAQNPDRFPFREVPVVDDGVHVTPFVERSVLEYESTDIGFNPLPPRAHFVTVYCLLLGGESPSMKLTYSSFCAETEMAAVLRMKTNTGGLCTDKLGGRNCTIDTARISALVPRQIPKTHRVRVSIGRPRMVPTALGNFPFDDFYNVLYCNEQATKLKYASLRID
ncbi:MAG: hypothetical protein ABSH08_02970 [Tepidisphaeraceae bacterium]|jgi:hypothetical protein